MNRSELIVFANSHHATLHVDVGGQSIPVAVSERRVSAFDGTLCRRDQQEVAEAIAENLLSEFPP